MRVGSLFSGIGGFDLGLERAGLTTQWQVENDPYCNRVLAKHWPQVQRYGDITTIRWEEVPCVDLVCGGWPCQPFSCAGKRRGPEDDRYLWPEVVRCLQALKPTWFLGENVPGFVGLGLDQALTDLESLGYETQTFNIPACAVDAPHLRKRVWVVAYSTQFVQYGGGVARSEGRGQSSNGGEDVAHAEREGPQGYRGQCELGEARSQVEVGGSRWWLPEPGVGRVAHGVSHRVDRLRGLGNAVVPQMVEAFGRMIVASEPRR